VEWDAYLSYRYVCVILYFFILFWDSFDCLDIAFLFTAIHVEWVLYYFAIIKLKLHSIHISHVSEINACTFLHFFLMLSETITRSDTSEWITIIIIDIIINYFFYLYIVCDKYLILYIIIYYIIVRKCNYQIGCVRSTVPWCF
jgi:hypothetical protein